MAVVCLGLSATHVLADAQRIPLNGQNIELNAKPPADKNGYAQAPVPGNAPNYTPNTDDKKGPSLGPNVFNTKTSRSADGFTNGSTYDPERDHRPPAGVQLNVPLDK